MNRNKRKITPLKDLNLSDRFLFDEVMEDSNTQQDVLSIIFGREISLLQHNETEKEFRISPSIRSIRMDVFSEDEDHIVYDTEVQAARKTDLPKRSRYYQALLDTSLLEPGIPNYNLLNNSYLILIMTFDLFEQEKYQYTFKPQCLEVPDCTLEDGATRIFLNTKGKNDGEVSKELAEFLHYIEDTTDIAAENTGSERIKRIHERVRKVKSSEKIGVKYMQAWEEKYFAEQEAREKGLTEGRAVGLAEGHAVGRAEGLAEGARNKLKEVISKKLQKGNTETEISNILEEDIETIRELIAELHAESQK